MKKVLILSCSTGQGHNSCAQAVQEYFVSKGIVCDIRDGLSYISEGVAQFISWGHSFIYRRIPGLFRWGYGYSEKHPELFQQGSGIYKILSRGAESMAEDIVEKQYDAVICTHVLTAIMLTHMQKIYPQPVATAMIMTDYACYPGMEETSMQMYFIPDASLAEEFVCCGIAREKIAVTGIPICQHFAKKIERADAKRLLNLPANNKHLLVMCGSMGCGPIAKMLKHLVKKLPAHIEVSVICGSNRKLQRTLERRYKKEKHVHIVGYTKQMSLYMDAADLCLMKPGGLSVTEAAAKNLPMAFINAVAGCEQYNMDYFVKRGTAVASDSPRALVEQCVKVLGTSATLHHMENMLQNGYLPHSAARIFRMTQMLCTERRYWKEAKYEEKEQDKQFQISAECLHYAGLHTAQASD